MLLALSGTANAADVRPADRVARTVDTVAAHHVGQIKPPTRTPDGGFSAMSAGATVTLPAKGDGLVSIGGSASISLPAEAGSGTAERAADGTVVYPAGAAGVSTAVEVLPGGGRILTVIGSAHSPSEYTYKIRGANLKLSADGGIDMTPLVDAQVNGIAGTVSGGVAGHIEKPWAVDANGTPVPTRYELSDGGFVQVVDFNKDTAFPVVADPSYGMSYWVVPTIWWNKYETNRIATGAIGGTVICAAATYFGGPAAGLLCALSVYSTIQYAQWAVQDGQCVLDYLEPAAFSPREYTGSQCY
jgi:hypothetical protein